MTPQTTITAQTFHPRYVLAHFLLDAARSRRGRVALWRAEVNMTPHHRQTMVAEMMQDADDITEIAALVLSDEPQVFLDAIHRLDTCVRDEVLESAPDAVWATVGII